MVFVTKSPYATNDKIWNSASDDNIWRVFSSQKVFILERKKPGVPLDFLSKNSYYLGRGLHAVFGRFGVFFLPRAAMIFIFFFERM